MSIFTRTKQWKVELILLVLDVIGTVGLKLYVILGRVRLKGFYIKPEKRRGKIQLPYFYVYGKNLNDRL